MLIRRFLALSTKVFVLSMLFGSAFTVEPARADGLTRYDAIPVFHKAGRYPFVAWDGQRVWSFGGYSAKDEIWSFDPVTRTARKSSTKLPTSLSSGSTVWDGQSIYLFGGDVPGIDHQAGAKSHILRFTPATEELVATGAHLPRPLLETAAFWDGTYAYILGGLTQPGASNEIHRFDPRTNSVVTLAEKLPHDRGGGEVAYVGGAAYYIGGFNCSEEPGTPVTCVSSPSDTPTLKFVPGNPVETLSTPSTNLGRGATVGSAGTTAYIFRFGSVYSYDTLTDTYSYRTALHKQIGDAGVAFDGNRFFLVGGYDPSTGSELDEVTEFDVATSRSQAIVVQGLPWGRGYMTGASIGGYTYLFGGYPRGDEVLRYDQSSGVIRTLGPTVPDGLQNAMVRDDTIYLLGRHFNGLYSYVPATGSFSTLSSTLPTGQSTVGVIVDSMVYVFASNTNPNSQGSPVATYDLDAGFQGSSAARIPPGAGRAQGAFEYGGRIVVIYAGAIFAFDPVAQTFVRFSSSLPKSIYDPSVVWDGHSAFIHGGVYQDVRCGNGRCATYHIATNNIYRFDPSSDTLVKMSRVLPENLVGIGGVFDGTDIFLFGGYAQVSDSEIPVFEPRSYVLKYRTAPNALTNVTAAIGPGRGEITLSWSLPPNNTYSWISAIRIYRATATGTYEALGEVSPQVRTFTDSGLPDRWRQVYKIVAVQGTVEGDPSVIGAWTPSKPASPLLVTGAPHATQAVVAWVPSSDSGGVALTGFMVYRRTATGSVRVADAPPSARSIVVDSCALGQTCRFFVTSANVVSESPPSSDVVVAGTSPS